MASRVRVDPREHPSPVHSARGRTGKVVRGQVPREAATSGWRDSNPRPPRPERGALPTALHPEAATPGRYSSIRGPPGTRLRRAARRRRGRGTGTVGRICGEHGDRTRRTDLARISRHQGTWLPSRGLPRHGWRPPPQRRESNPLPPALTGGCTSLVLLPGVEPRRAQHLWCRPAGCSPTDFGPFERHGSASWPGSCARLAPLPLRRGLSLEVPMCGTWRGRCAEGEGFEPPSGSRRRTAFEAGPIVLSLATLHARQVWRREIREEPASVPTFAPPRR